MQKLFSRVMNGVVLGVVLLLISIPTLSSCNDKGSPSFSNVKSGKVSGSFDLYAYVSPKAGDVLVYKINEKAPDGSAKFAWALYKYDFRYDKKLKKKVLIGDGYRILDIGENGDGAEADPVPASSIIIDKEKDSFKAYFTKEYGQGYKINDTLANKVEIGKSIDIERIVFSDYISGGSVKPYTNGTIVSAFANRVFPEIDKQKKIDAFYAEVQSGNQVYYSWFAKGCGFLEILSASDMNGDELIQQLVYRKTANEAYGKKPRWFETALKKIAARK